ncbi:MAG: metallophosphatase family protein [Candidatus Thermoplasmatota archaeon]|jgi:predicted phosphodiesterase|nr:metallophosphatase family protein [Candidatus Thermoplasmatota archaeon]
MLFAVVSDLHGNIEAVKAVWRELDDVSRIYCLGDIVGIGPRPGEVLDMVLSDPRLARVKGNHDHNTLNLTELGPIRTLHRGPHHLWIRGKLTAAQIGSLDSPVHLQESMDGVRLSFMHRHPTDFHSKVPYFDEPTSNVLDDFYSDVMSDVLFFGHTHVPLDMEGAGGKRYINPGAVGVQNGGLASYALAEVIEGAVRIERRTVRYDLDKVIEDLNEQRAPFAESIVSNFFRGPPAHGTGKD